MTVYIKTIYESQHFRSPVLFSGAVTIKGALNLSADLNLTGDVTVGKTLTVSGQSYFKALMNVSSSINATGTITAAKLLTGNLGAKIKGGALNVSNSLNVTGTANIAKAIKAQNNITCDGDLHVGFDNATAALKCIILNTINGTPKYIFWGSGVVPRYSNAKPTKTDNGTALA